MHDEKHSAFGQIELPHTESSRLNEIGESPLKLTAIPTGPLRATKPETIPTWAEVCIEPLSELHTTGSAWNETPNLEIPVTDRIGATTPDPLTASANEITSHLRHDDLVTAAVDGGRGLRAEFVACALVLAFGLGWIGGSGSYSFFKLDAEPSHLTQNQSSSPRIVATDPRNGDAEKKRNSAASTDAPTPRKVATLPATSPDYANKPSPGAWRSATAPTTAIASATPVPPRSIAPQNDEKALPRLTSTPETRPETIEGWTVRLVNGQKVVLEGPHGISTAMLGDTVPGLGRIDSIVLWGGRWIVATTKGLVTTQ